MFDFDLTLPIIATEFLLLMTILDKTVFGPVGKALDDRDELIRSQLAAVGDNSSEVEGLIVRARNNLLFFARARDGEESGDLPPWKAAAPPSAQRSIGRHDLTRTDFIKRSANRNRTLAPRPRAAFILHFG